MLNLILHSKEAFFVLELKDEGKIVETIDAGYQYFGVLNTATGIMSDKVVREAINLGLDREDYIKALKASQEEENEVPFLEFMFEEHAKNLQKEIENYKLSMENDEVV